MECLLCRILRAVCRGALSANDGALSANDGAAQCQDIAIEMIASDSHPLVLLDSCG